MGCNDGPIQSWIDWQHSAPVTPLELLANAQLNGPFGTDLGLFVDSSTYISPPAPTQLLKVTGARVIDSTGPASRAILTNPITTQTVGAANNPNRIEIDFNVAPTPTSITGAPSITVSGVSTGPIAGIVASLPSSTTARLTLPAALAAGDTYIVNVNGTTAPAVTFSGTNLDGEALGLPSGDGIAGGDFAFGIRVVAGTRAAPLAASPLPPQSNWFPSIIALSANPVCVALHSDNLERVANAAQWNFQHITAIQSANLALPLLKETYLRVGEEWQMNIGLDCGYRSYAEFQLSILNNAGTRGDCQGTIPAVVFNQHTYFGPVTLQVTLKKQGRFIIGLRAIDTNGYYSMYESVWNVVR